MDTFIGRNFSFRRRSENSAAIEWDRNHLNSTEKVLKTVLISMISLAAVLFLPVMFILASADVHMAFVIPLFLGVILGSGLFYFISIYSRDIEAN